ncbi:succinylglutamate desuccinylase/aspartoacylase family protein [Aliiruegeria haliotis]|nr:succinylglutamate desuccinylase/aspartoacylase family protein [Aliiruegeria haliotis]
MAPKPSPAAREEFALPQVASGTSRALSVQRFGLPGARPKAYLQAGLHADELPGMLALRELAQSLRAAAERGEILGEVIVVPVANPIGFAQHHYAHLQGRYETGSAGNFNRGYPDLAAAVAARIDGKLGPDADANVATIRTAMSDSLDEMAPESELEVLRHRLLALAHDADIMLDLHADNQAQVHLYTGTPLWPDARDLAAEIDARAVLLAEISGGNPFDEACSGPWWSLAAANPNHPIPPACLAATVELRSNNDVDETLARDDAAALYRFLVRRGVVAGDAGALPRLHCEATDLTAMQQVKAPVAGLVVYKAQLGDVVRADQVVAEIVDPLGDVTEVRARTEGCLFSRHDQPVAWPGKIIGKIAGTAPLPDRKGKLLSD